MKPVTHRGFLSVDRRSLRRPAACRRQKPTLTSDVTLYDAGLHNRSRHRARNWVHSRIWFSRDYFLSTPSTRKTTIVPVLSLSLSDGTSCGSPHGPHDRGDSPRSPCASSALTALPPRAKDPPQPIAAQGRADPAYHPDRRSNVGDASSGRTAPPIQSVSSDRDKHALCGFCNTAEFFSHGHSVGQIFSFDVTHLRQQAGVSP